MARPTAHLILTLAVRRPIIRLCLDLFARIFKVHADVERVCAVRSLRAFFAVMIALSLSLAPIATARAMMLMHGAADAQTTAMEDAAAHDAEMSDCMKAMQAQSSETVPDCGCCDTPAKSPCPDNGGCAAKCNSSIAAILPSAAIPSLDLLARHVVAVSREPPDWRSSPPAPPPRD